MGSADMDKLSDLPHHIIFGKILRPTKVAVQTSFILSRQWSSDSVLDFDEDDDSARHKDPQQHDRFVRFLKGYLEYYCHKGHHPLDTLRFKMKRMNTSEDATILGRWLELACEKGVKTLDISCPRRIDEPHWCLSWFTTFANAKFLTILKLECVRFTSFGNTWDGTDGPPPILPSLKTLSLKGIRLGHKDFALMLVTCPSLEYLSITAFRFQELYLPTFTLKSLEVRPMFCCPIYVSLLHPEQAHIIESFTWIGDQLSQSPNTMKMQLFLSIAKSLTYLNLQCVKIVEIPSANNQGDEPFFPSLKTMSFTNILELDDKDLLSILLGCPSLEYLSLKECCVGELKCLVPSSSLKSLEIEHCSKLRLVQIDDAKNLESFTFVSLSHLSPEPSCKKVILHNSFNLKNINICVVDLVEFSLNGCQTVKSGDYLNLVDSFQRIAPAARIKIALGWAAKARAWADAMTETDNQYQENQQPPPPPPSSNVLACQPPPPLSQRQDALYSNQHQYQQWASPAYYQHSQPHPQTPPQPPQQEAWYSNQHQYQQWGPLPYYQHPQSQPQPPPQQQQEAWHPNQYQQWGLPYYQHPQPHLRPHVPLHLPPPPPHPQTCHPPHNQEWGAPPRPNSQAWEYQARNNEQDWAAKARAWADARTRTDNQDQQLQFALTARQEEQNQYYQQSQSVDPRCSDVHHQSLSTSSYREVPVSGTATDHQPGVHPKDTTLIGFEPSAFGCQAERSANPSINCVDVEDRRETDNLRIDGAKEDVYRKREHRTKKEDEKPRHKQFTDSSRHKRKHSSSIASMGRSSKHDSVFHANHPSDNASEYSKRGKRSRSRSPIRWRI